jgi:hypothetical protein
VKKIIWIGLGIFACYVPALHCAPMAKAGSQCEYPGVGVGANVIFGGGGFCDFPTEINGSHWHCEAGGVNLGGAFVFNQNGLGVSNSGNGIQGASCSFRCPDNTMAPAPNPPGAWKTYMIPVANACKDHMEPAGFWSEPVRPDEGGPVVPPVGPPAPIPAPPDGGGSPPPGVGPNPTNQTAPGEPNP